MRIFGEIKLEIIEQIVYEYFDFNQVNNKCVDKGCGYLANADWKLY